MAGLSLTFSDAVLENAFRAHRAQHSRRWNSTFVAIVAISAAVVYLTAAAEADSRASAVYVEGAAAAAARVLALAQRFGSRQLLGLDALITGAVQQLQAAVAVFPLQVGATWAHKAAYALTHALQLLLHRILVARDAALGVALMATVAALLSLWRGHAPSNLRSQAGLMSARLSWLSLVVFNLCWWLPFTVSAAASLPEARFLQCAHSGVAAYWLQFHGMIVPLLLIATTVQPLVFVMQLPMLFAAWACSMVAAYHAKGWLHDDALCTHALDSTAAPHHTFARALGKHAVTLWAGVLLPGVAVWVLENKQRRAFLQCRSQQAANGGDTAGAVEWSSAAAAAHISINEQQPGGEQAVVQLHTAAISEDIGILRTSGSEAATAGAQPASAAVSFPQQQGAHSSPLVNAAGAKWSPAESGSTLYRSPFDTILVSLKITNGACCGGSTTDNLQTAAGEGSGSTSHHDSPSGVCQAVQCAVQSLREQGLLNVVHLSWSYFVGCVHVVLEMRVLMGMDEEQQQEQGQRVVDAARTKLGEEREVYGEVILPMQRDTGAVPQRGADGMEV